VDGDAYPTDTPLTANSTWSVATCIVACEFVLLAAQGVSVGKVEGAHSLSCAWAHEQADSPATIPFPPTPFPRGGAVSFTT